MNLLYITGPTSVGKTTLANKIGNNATIISLDAFSKSIRFVFNDFKLYSGKVSILPNINNDKFLQLVKIYIDYFIKDYPNKELIVEGCHFTPNDFLSIFPNANIIAIGITDKQTAFQQICKKDWIAGLDEMVKDEYVNQIVEYSVNLKENQGKYKYFEFGENYD